MSLANTCMMNHEVRVNKVTSGDIVSPSDFRVVFMIGNFDANCNIIGGSVSMTTC